MQGVLLQTLFGRLIVFLLMPFGMFFVMIDSFYRWIVYG